MSKYKKKSKFLKKNKFRIYRKVTIWALFSFSIFYGFLFWVNHDSLKISNVEVVGNKFTNTQEVLDIVEKHTSGKYLFLISKKNFLFISDKKIIDEINNILTVEHSAIERQNRNSFKIEIFDHEPIAVYCLDPDCYFVNKNGVLFVKAPNFHVNELVFLEGQISSDSDTTDVAVASVAENQSSILGMQYSNPETFKNLIETRTLLLDENIKIYKIATEDFETFSLKTISSTSLLVEKQNKPSEIVDNLKAALAQESIHEIQFNNIDYFDLRFKDKVFYKLK